jgi:hypothetical protein
VTGLCHADVNEGMDGACCMGRALCAVVVGALRGLADGPTCPTELGRNADSATFSHHALDGGAGTGGLDGELARRGRARGFLRMIVNGNAGWHPSLAASAGPSCLTALDYGRLWGQRPGVVGHTCRSELLVGLLLALTPRCPFRSREFGSGAGRPGPRWLTSVGVGPGRANGG